MSFLIARTGGEKDMKRMKAFLHENICGQCRNNGGYAGDT
jgi:hypothetical protein